MSVKVSVLSPLERMPVSSRAELVARLRPGVDGVLLESARDRGTLLPSVWAKVPEPEEFVDALWVKTGLPPGSWPADLRVFTYRTTEYADKGPREL
jgi:AMMECR1 domain-containing protein